MRTHVSCPHRRLRLRAASEGPHPNCPNLLGGIENGLGSDKIKRPGSHTRSRERESRPKGCTRLNKLTESGRASCRAQEVHGLASASDTRVRLQQPYTETIGRLQWHQSEIGNSEIHTMSRRNLTTTLGNMTSQPRVLDTPCTSQQPAESERNTIEHEAREGDGRACGRTTSMSQHSP